MSELSEFTAGKEVVIAMKYLWLGTGGRTAKVTGETRSGEGMPEDHPYRNGMVEVELDGEKQWYPPEDLIIRVPGRWP